MLSAHPRISRGSSRAARPIAAKSSSARARVELTAQKRLQAGLDGDAETRLDALERLGRLRAAGFLTPAEFDEQKALVLGHPGSELHSEPSSLAPRSHPSLVGRLCSWKFLPIGLVTGLALSFGTQPQETIRFVDQALSLVGA